MEARGAVDEEHGDVECADHLVVAPVEHLDADDAGDAAQIEGGREGEALDVFLRHTMGVERKAHVRQLVLESVEHERREVRSGQIGGREHGDLALIAQGGDDSLVVILILRDELGVDELLVAHLHRLVDDALARGFGKALCTIESLRDGIARETELVGNILDGDLVGHGSSLSEFATF